MRHVMIPISPGETSKRFWRWGTVHNSRIDSLVASTCMSVKALLLDVTSLKSRHISAAFELIVFLMPILGCGRFLSDEWEWGYAL